MSIDAFVQNMRSACLAYERDGPLLFSVGKQSGQYRAGHLTLGQLSLISAVPQDDDAARHMLAMGEELRRDYPLIVRTGSVDVRLYGAWPNEKPIVAGTSPAYPFLAVRVRDIYQRTNGSTARHTQENA